MIKSEKNNLKTENGITLIALVITVLILLILAFVGISSGIDTIRSSKFTVFTAELKIMQTEVNNWYQKYKNGDSSILTLGEEISSNSSVQSQANKVFTETEAEITSQEGYRYFSVDTIKSLGIEGVEQDVFINIEKRSIVSYKGFRYEGKTYYTLSQIPDGMYNVEYDGVEIKLNYGYGRIELIGKRKGEEIGELPTEEKEGYILEGWYTEEEGGEKITETTVASENVTYYAHWIPITYKVRLNAGTGYITDSDELYYDVECKYNETYNLEDYYSKVGKDNYVLIGWATTPGGNIVYNLDSELKNLTMTNGKTIDLYARYVTIQTRTWYWLGSAPGQSTGFNTIMEGATGLLNSLAGSAESSRFLRNFSMQIIPDDNKSLGNNSGISYAGYYSVLGWEDSLSNGETYGTDVTDKYYIQSIKAEISGYVSQYYDLYYSTYVRHIGFLGYAGAGQEAGTKEWYKPLEGIKVQLVRKGESKPESESGVTLSAFTSYNGNKVYQGANGTLTDNYFKEGTITPWQYLQLGVTGQSSPLKRFHVSLRDSNNGIEYIEYRGHFANTGWTSWVSGGTELKSGSNDLQAVSIRLTGGLEKYFDVYYAAHVANIGWMAWAKNGENAGTQGYGASYPMESLNIIIVRKGLTLEEVGSNLESICVRSEAFLQK